MALGCREAGRLSLDTVAGHAREAERLRLEAHLAFCRRCNDEHTALTLVRRLREAEPERLGPGAHQDIRRALTVGQPRVAVPRRRMIWPFGLAAVGMVALTLIGGMVWRQRVYRLVDGDVTVASATGSRTTSLPRLATEPITFLSTSGGTVSVGDAIAELARQTKVIWSPGGRTLTLSAGSITVDVEHQVGRSFQVRTAKFTVEVVGTRFTVELTRVRTLRGVVRVLRPDGTLIVRLEAGQSWRADARDGQADNGGARDGDARRDETSPAPSTAPSEARAVVATAPAAQEATPARSMMARKSDGGPRPNAVPARAAIAPLTVADRLAEARHCLSHGDAIAARRLVTPLFRQSFELAAEARVLFAESFLVEGRYADAVDAYHIVARDFPRSEQAETSLFAIAQLESEHGRGGDARAALRAYVSRYPHGRFSREVGDRLTRLSSPD